MKRKSSESFAILHRRKAVSQQYLQGVPQFLIAKHCDVNQSTISRDLEVIFSEWRETIKTSAHEQRMYELAKINENERAAWQGWHLSLQAEVSLERGTNDGKAFSKKRKRGQAGDPRFLMIVDKCIERRCQMFGIDKPKELPPLEKLLEHLERESPEFGREVRRALTADVSDGGGQPVEPKSLAPPGDVPGPS